MIHPIVHYPASSLLVESKPVVEFGPELEILARDLEETCHANQGLGLAAPQIGINQRVVVISMIGHPARVLVNPSWRPAEVTISSQIDERCLSLPGVEVKVERVFQIEVEALTINREPVTFTATGIEAEIIQHECDHLEGKVIVDHLSAGQRSLTLHTYRKQMKKRARRA